MVMANGSHGVDRFECRFVYSWPVYPWPYAQTLVPTHVFRSCELVCEPIFGNLSLARRPRSTDERICWARSRRRSPRPLFAIRCSCSNPSPVGIFFKLCQPVSQPASNPASQPASQPISQSARPIPPVTLKSTSSWTVSDRQELWSVRWKA